MSVVEHRYDRLHQKRVLMQMEGNLPTPAVRIWSPKLVAEWSPVEDLVAWVRILGQRFSDERTETGSRTIIAARRKEPLSGITKR